MQQERLGFLSFLFLFGVWGLWYPKPSKREREKKLDGIHFARPNFNTEAIRKLQTAKDG